MLRCVNLRLLIMKFGFAIDRGGTFTDVYVSRSDGSSRVLKLLSEDPKNYADAPTEAIRRVLEQETGVALPRSQPIPTEQIAWIRMGTTVATNALLERNGERTALAVTKGFRDLLYIGNQSRPQIFDLNVRLPDVLYEEVVEVDERVVMERADCLLPDLPQCPAVTSTTDEKLRVVRAVQEDELRKALTQVYDKGVRSLAVLLLHSYMFPDHETAVGRVAKEVGFTNISLSSQIMPMIKAVPRGFTATADAYLTPKIQEYLRSFTSGFENNLDGVRVLFMQSDGGLCSLDRFYGCRAILSGPAGGVVGVSLTAYDKDTRQPVIGFDMGGTSTDVSRYAGELAHVFETTTAGVTIQAPQLDINTVAAGGGSRLFFRNGLFAVGPESARADPGPVCYRKDGFLAITDANLVLGRILIDYFPKIFGPNEDQPLDIEASREAFKRLTDEINLWNSQALDNSQKPKSMEEVAMGYLEVANEAMCRPIRSLTQAKGYDTSQHILACFGGAGGQHACAIAQALGMRTVYVHKHSGILSSYGLALADVVHEAQEPSHSAYVPENFATFDNRLEQLSEHCRNQLREQGFDASRLSTECYLHLRYERTDCALMCTAAAAAADGRPAPKHGDFLAAFEDAYKREFGFIIPDRKVIVDDLRVRGIGRSAVCQDTNISVADEGSTPSAETTTRCFFKTTGWVDRTPVYLLSSMLAKHRVQGPAVIIDANTTIIVEPRCTAEVTANGNVKIELNVECSQIGVAVDPIQLSIFSHRFMSIAEQMGRILQRTSISTNIKERLDFSCALFGPDGGLIANAPHIPVHLGAMQETVRFQLRTLGDGLRDGDVILCNHPDAGGSHLPDLTVITPVYYKGSRSPVFFVANRGHHSDIGGLVPGSMPPNAIRLEQEGAAFVSFKLVEGGHFREQELTEALMAPGKVAGCSGTRNLNDNLSDLRAQVAANQKGIGLVCELIDAYGLDVVQAYMQHIQENAERAVRNMLKEMGSSMSSALTAVDYMDDGTPIALTVNIDKETGSATFDFSGTGCEVYNSCNAPPAVTMSAVIYSLRCLVGSNIPLNQGCLAPITIHVPKGTILSAHSTAAVVGGNVLTSQRIVDVILKAFNAVAASAGDMNNVTFGNAEFGYYETVCGGSGAGEGWHGRHAVHTHMTNTRITDVEIMERRYPIIIDEFHVREGSGGEGRWRGGCGVIRKYRFRTGITLSLLTERRVHRPYGLEGGGPGSTGSNYLCIAKHGERTVNLGGKISVDVEPGDIFTLLTSGGGGWGKAEA